MRDGKSQFHAVIYAGVSRLRPIVMTSISTIAGMLPIALAFGADGEVRSPMAIAVIGGFTTSTLFTLVVVPVTFCYVDNFLHWAGKLWKNDQAEQVKNVLNLEETLRN
jgi:multidrug efflux pump subunit AcrB